MDNFPAQLYYSTDMTSRITIITILEVLFSMKGEDFPRSMLRKWTEPKATTVESEILNNDHDWLPQKNYWQVGFGRLYMQAITRVHPH